MLRILYSYIGMCNKQLLSSSITSPDTLILSIIALKHLFRETYTPRCPRRDVPSVSPRCAVFIAALQASELTVLIIVWVLSSYKGRLCDILLQSVVVCDDCSGFYCPAFIFYPPSGLFHPLNNMLVFRQLAEPCVLPSRVEIFNIQQPWVLFLQYILQAWNYVGLADWSWERSCGNHREVIREHGDY
jgi:hypothetical protein